MKNKYKQVFSLGVVLIFSLLTITGCASKKNLAENESTYQKLLSESQTKVAALEKELAEREVEKEELEKENSELQAKLTQILSDKSNVTTLNQAMADLMDIYRLYKSGKNDEAFGKIKKIEPMGFDDEALAFYEILKDVLE